MKSKSLFDSKVFFVKGNCLKLQIIFFLNISETPDFSAEIITSANTLKVLYFHLFTYPPICIPRKLIFSVSRIVKFKAKILSVWQMQIKHEDIVGHNKPTQ